MKYKSKHLDKNIGFTLKHYTKRLKEKYPKYTNKEIEFFLRSIFNFTKITIRNSYKLEDDVEIQLGNFIKLKFNRILYKYSLFHMLRNIYKKNGREGIETAFSRL